MMKLTEELKQEYQKCQNNSIFNLNSYFNSACLNADLSSIQYLLTSPELASHADIHHRDNIGLISAVLSGSLETVQYLLTSPDLIEHADTHTEGECAYQEACLSHIPIAEYLLSFNGEQCIPFQKTDCNLEWAMDSRHNTLILAMMKNLFLNDIVEYVSCLPKVKDYNIRVFDKIKEFENEISLQKSEETLLFI